VEGELRWHQFKSEFEVAIDQSSSLRLMSKIEVHGVIDLLKVFQCFMTDFR
jgi:hypothetical protein